MKKRLSILALIAVTLFSCKDKYENLKDGLYAEIKTNKGTMLLQLEMEKSPVTVANFVTLVEGKNSFVGENFKNKPFYDGLNFHRVESNFMIQGGDPDGNGSGGPGYSFKDEFSDLKFDTAGILAMANSGPATNGSQFFITHVPTPFLDGKHTIFGHILEKGMDVVNKIGVGDRITKIKIIRKGAAAKKFDAVKIFSDYFSHKEEDQKKQALIDAEKAKAELANASQIQKDKVAQFASMRATATKLPSGLQIKMLNTCSNKKPTNGSTVYVHYAGFLENGNLFDTSIESVAKAFGKFDPNRATAKQYIPLQCAAGAYQFIPGFNEGLSKMCIGDKAILFIPTNLAYGEAGAGTAVPPNANIIFEVELLDQMPQQ
jgi:cyclophilin family peptidyl-prolyl cis-trans isomerase